MAGPAVTSAASNVSIESSAHTVAAAFGAGARSLRVAVVGSGPAGLYTAEALIKQVAALANRAGHRGGRARPAAHPVRPGALRRRTGPQVDQVDRRLPATGARESAGAVPRRRAFRHRRDPRGHCSPATTPSCTRRARCATGGSACRARTCQAAWRPPTSSTGTAGTRTSTRPCSRLDAAGGRGDRSRERRGRRGPHSRQDRRRTARHRRP